MKIWTTWKAYKRDKIFWYDFKIIDKKDLDWEIFYTVKITSWKYKWKFSWIFEKEIDEFLVFNK